MGRRTNREELVALINKLRREIPDIVLRTTLITGFPGETEEEFARMVVSGKDEIQPTRRFYLFNGRGDKGGCHGRAGS